MIKRDETNKRGLSPVVASVLLILLVVLLAVLIFFWARGFISEQIEKFGQPIDSICSSIEFDAHLVDSQSSLEVINKGNTAIHHLEIKLIKGGTEEFWKFDYPIGVGKAEKKEVNLNMQSGEYPDEIIVYPALLGGVKGKDSNKVFTCLDKGIKISTA